MCICLRKLYRQYWIWQINDDLRRRHFLLNCEQVICIAISIVQQYRWRCTSPWRYLEEIKHRSLATQSPVLSVQNLLISSTQPHNPLSSCCYSHLVPLIVHKQLDASFNQSKPFSQLQTRHGPLFRSKLRLLSLFKGAVLLNFDQIVERGLLFVEFQQVEDVFSTAWRICALDLIYWVWCKRRKCLTVEVGGLLSSTKLRGRCLPEYQSLTANIFYKLILPAKPRCNSRPKFLRAGCDKEIKRLISRWHRIGHLPKCWRWARSINNLHNNWLSGTKLWLSNTGFIGFHYISCDKYRT